MMAQAYGIRNRRARQRALLISAGPEEHDLSELGELLRTAGVAVAGEMTQKRATPDPDRYFGKGKLAELKQAIKDSDANIVAVDDELAPRQERNLEAAIDTPVIDRTAVILDIFADHAGSAEGKLQVELAQLEYNMARMRGLWTHLERLGGSTGGGIATRGPGETQIETDRRLARSRIAALRRRLERTRGDPADHAQRARAGGAAHRRAGGLHQRRQVHAAERSHRRRGRRPGPAVPHARSDDAADGDIGPVPYLLTDTVGFIRKLPHQLVEAFGATLEEAMGADLLLHVVDASAPEEELHEMLSAVEDVLQEIGAGEVPTVLALNKADLVDAERRRELSFRFPKAVQVSAATGEGLDDLREAVEGRFLATLRPMELLLPYGEGGSLSELHELAGRGGARGHARGRRGPSARAGSRGRPFRALRAQRQALMELRFRRLDAAATPPARAHDDDAGFDLFASEAADLGPGERTAVGTGIALAIPEGHAGLVLPRSGLARKHGITLVNTPGLIDSGYRGEVRVLLLNTDRSEPFSVRAGRADRAAGDRAPRGAGTGGERRPGGDGARRGRLRLDRAGADGSPGPRPR